jgi:glycosyltransferase involved in cell wall biosynthesis
MSNEVELTVLMPCLNEAKTLGACLEKIHQACRASGIPYEALVSDNGSNDGSIEMAQQLGARVVHAPQKGYGAALMYGFSQAKGKYVLFADADDTYDFREIPSFWQQVQKGKDVVIGTRLKGSIHSGAMPFLHRYLGTPVLTFLIRLLYAIPISDCNSGMRLLKKTIYEQLKMKSPGMEFASEMLVKLGLTNTRVTEIPIHLWPDRRGRPPHLKTWRDGWRHLRFILMFAPHKTLIWPGQFLFFVSTLAVFSFLSGPVNLLGRVYDYHSQLAFATLGLIGFSMWSFGQLICFFSHVNEFVLKNRRSFYMSLSLEKKLLISVAAILLGLSLSGMVLIEWIESGFGPLAQVHKFIASLYCIVTGFISALLAATFFVFQYDELRGK